MKTESHMNTLSRAGRSLLVLGAVVGCGASALATDKVISADAQARHRQERAACMNGPSNQDRVACLREADAAFAEAQDDGLDDGPAPYARNAPQRCEGLPDGAHRACVARMQGQGSRRGSAASGAIYRELVLREIVPPSTGMPSTDPQTVPAK